MKLPDQMIGLAEDIITKMSGEFEPGKFEDRYEEAVAELIKSKQTGQPAALPQVAKPHNVVNLMQALRESVAREQAARPPEKAASRKAKVEEVQDRPMAASKSKKAPAKSVKPLAKPATRKKA